MSSLTTAPVAQSKSDVCLALWTGTMQRSVLRQMLAVVSQPGILSFAGGLPAPELFPVAEYATALNHVLQTDPGALQYGPPYRPLKAHIVRLMALRGVACREEQVFITTGAQQALDVLSRLFLDPGGTVLLEEIVYTGIQQAVAPMQPCVLPLRTDLETGMDVDQVEAYLEDGHRPAFLYVIPDAHNPLGVSLSAEKRRRLAALAAAYNLPIVEDDPYGLLTFDGQNLPPIRAFNDDHVFYVGSFSKILAPALRLGWMMVPEPLAHKLTVIKEAGDLESSALTQRAVAAYLDAGHLPSHLDHLRSAYRVRRDAMLGALQANLPPTFYWTHPRGGMFIWVRLPKGLDAAVLLTRAVEEARVAFIPGHAFAHCGADASNFLRLNFSNCCISDIEDGIARLATVLRSA